MRRFRSIIESAYPVPIDSLWIKDKELKVFTKGEWVTIGGNGTTVSDKILKVAITEDQFINILSGKVENINIEGANSDYSIILLQVNNHNYFLNRNIQTNGTAMYSTEAITVEDGTPTMNQIQAIVSIGIVSITAKFIELAPETVSLEIGDSNEIKSHNLSQLRNGHFFTQLDYGYGVGTWQSSTGGFAHVTTAYGNEVFYIINADGSIEKDEDYIKPNEPYTIQLDASKIGTVLDDITAAHILQCGEIIIDGSTGPVTYTRSVDSKSSAIYFTSSKKDATLQVLTYTVSNKTITSSVASQRYTLPLSTSEVRGGIKIGFSQTGRKYPVQLQNEKAYVEVPWTDTVYSLPAATKISIGGVKAGTNIAALDENADLATVVGTVNNILTQLKSAGVLI